jgi:hypothetical protein
MSTCCVRLPACFTLHPPAFPRTATLRGPGCPGLSAWWRTWLPDMQSSSPSQPWPQRRGTATTRWAQASGLTHQATETCIL